VVELNPQPDAPATLHFSANGRYVVQLAALQSEAAIDASWRRFVSRAPGLFAGASMDVQRADLGPRGIYHRVRAGYFASSDDATLFCERIRQMGQDCIVAALDRIMLSCLLGIRQQNSMTIRVPSRRAAWGFIVSAKPASRVSNCARSAPIFAKRLATMRSSGSTRKAAALRA
jgi:hypothetical protein